jgi:hypothetical protein
MTFIEYITKYTTKEKGVGSIYKCNITGFHFGWEDVDMHMNYLKRNKKI